MKHDTYTANDYVKFAAKGFIMGSADVVPGVSGGTMALILGIYERLINSIRCINRKTISLLLKLRLRDFFIEVPWKFLLSVATGILLAVFSLARPIEFLLEHYEIYVWSFFFGLILASVWIVKKKIKEYSTSIWLLVTLGVLIGYVVAGLVPAETPNTAPFIFFSGFIAICAMILPGVSGSYLLVVLGKYQQILHAVNDRDFLTLLIFTAGAVIGLLIFAKFLSFMLRSYHDPTMGILIGLMLGSLRKIWPWKVDGTAVLPVNISRETVFTLGLVILGIALVTAIESYSRVKKSKILNLKS